MWRALPLLPRREWWVEATGWVLGEGEGEEEWEGVDVYGVGCNCSKNDGKWSDDNAIPFFYVSANVILLTANTGDVSVCVRVRVQVLLKPPKLRRATGGITATVTPPGGCWRRHTLTSGNSTQ